VHLKLGEPEPRMVALLDPFATADERVEELIAALGPAGREA
jgi:proteasome accessory factor A